LGCARGQAVLSADAVLASLRPSSRSDDSRPDVAMGTAYRRVARAWAARRCCRGVAADRHLIGLSYASARTLVATSYAPVVFVVGHHVVNLSSPVMRSLDTGVAPARPQSWTMRRLCDTLARRALRAGYRADVTARSHLQATCRHRATNHRANSVGAGTMSAIAWRDACVQVAWLYPSGGDVCCYGSSGLRLCQIRPLSVSCAGSRRPTSSRYDGGEHCRSVPGRSCPSFHNPGTSTIDALSPRLARERSCNGPSCHRLHDSGRHAVSCAPHDPVMSGGPDIGEQATSALRRPWPLTSPPPR
jgi:hypothetical protein